MKKIYPVVYAVMALAVIPALAATAKKQSVLQSGTTVRTKVEAKGIYSQECYDAYYGCMDQFCITENSNGGSCGCSNKNEKFEAQLLELTKKMADIDAKKDEEVERINLGAKADIVFGDGKREYDADGKVVYDRAKEKNKRDAALQLWNKTSTDEDDEDEDVLTEKGAALFTAADQLCREQIEEDCDKDFKFLKQVYSRQIESDCKAFENVLAEKQKEADTKLADAESAIRNALKDSFESANKYNQGECMVELKKCMQGPDACGADWDGCVSITAAENIAKDSELGSLKDIDITGTGLYSSKSKTIGKVGGTFSASAMFKISPIVLRILEAKRPICERVLDQCMAVRDIVWEAFLNEAAPDLKIAEGKSESKQRQSCLKTIPDCIHKACKDDIAGKGKETMDACLSRPEMAKSFCKPEIEACQRVDPNIWAYVKDQLAAMRVDACTQEVKDCFTDPMRCGPNFENCIGMDYEFIHEMCPIEKLVACKKDGKDFSMAELDSMLRGLYLNIDTTLSQACEDLVDAKMIEICGSTSDCNRFAADDYIGTGSLASQKDGDIYRITGMISFGSINIGTPSTAKPLKVDGKEDDVGNLTSKDGGEVLAVGKIGIKDYMDKALANSENVNVPNKDAIVQSINAELNNIAGKINNVIDLIESDQKIQYCVTGRNLGQILGPNAEKTKTDERFPNLLDKVKMQIAIAALNKASDNYNKKLQEYIAKATADKDADLAQYMCQMAPVWGGAPVGGNGDKSTQTLTPPYAISYEIGRGINNALLAQGGRGSGATGTSAVVDSTAGANKFAQVVDSFTGLGGQKVKSETGNGTREMWAIFNRESRICHFCTSTITKNCSTVSKKGFLGIGATSEASCTESEPVEKCEDIQM